MVTVFLHCWQRTEQHQENLQEQRCTTSARPALYPGPQQTSSQPSGANREVPGHVKTTCELLQLLLCTKNRVTDSFLTVTSPTSSSRYAIVGVKMAEIWRRGKIHEVSSSWGFNVGVTREQRRSGSNTRQTDLNRCESNRLYLCSKWSKIKTKQKLSYLCSSIKTFLQHYSDPSKWRHDLPAGPQLTWARDAMTLALHLHVVKDGLRMTGLEATDNAIVTTLWQHKLMESVANLSTSLIVVKVHERAPCGQPFASLWFIHKSLRESYTIGQVVTTSRPLESWRGTEMTCISESIKLMISLNWWYFWKHEDYSVRR